MNTIFRSSVIIMLFMISITTFSQTGINLGQPLNSLLESEFYPSISGNGKTLLLQSTTGEDGQAEVVISYLKGGVWTRPETVPNIKQLNSKTALSPDYALSYDGNTIVFSSPKYGGVGGSDIWIMNKNASGWTPSTNPGKPINSIGNEGDPYLSPDGRFLYFVRYSDKKTPAGKPCGKIFVSEKTGNLWKEPKELPATINKGCECSPRIMADNQTLLFSSMRTGGKGGYDFYTSRIEDDGNWTEPKAVALINTDKDDYYASIPASGDFIFYSAPGKKGTDIFKIKTPDEFKPKKVLLKEGTIKDLAQKNVPARITAYDLNKNKITALYETDFSGSYQVFLPEGTSYDFSATSTLKGFTYYSEYIDLGTMEKYSEKRTDIKLSPLNNGVTITLNNLFVTPEGKVSDKSNFELLRIQRLFQENAGLKAEIGVHKAKIILDTIPHAALTETFVDSFLVADPSDSTGVRKITIAKKFYHNDTSPKEAKEVVKAIVAKGVPSNSISGRGYGDKEPKAPNTSPENIILNQRIELKIVK